MGTEIQVRKSSQIAKEHGGKALALAAGGAGGTGVYFGADILAKGTDIPTTTILENLDKALSVELFLNIGGISLAIVALLIPKLYELADIIKKNKENLAADAPIKVEFKRVVRAQKRLLGCFLFCLLGVISSFAFDGPLEYQPPEFQEADIHSHIEATVGLEWADMAEATSSVSLLFISLSLLGLGARSFLTAINDVNDTLEK